MTSLFDSNLYLSDSPWKHVQVLSGSEALHVVSALFRKVLSDFSFWVVSRDQNRKNHAEVLFIFAWRQRRELPGAEGRPDQICVNYEICRKM